MGKSSKQKKDVATLPEGPIQRLFFNAVHWEMGICPGKMHSDVMSMAIPGSDSLEVPTLKKRPIFQAYVREYPHKIRPYMVQYLQFRILEFPLILGLCYHPPNYHFDPCELSVNTRMWARRPRRWYSTWIRTQIRLFPRSGDPPTKFWDEEVEHHGMLVLNHHFRAQHSGANEGANHSPENRNDE